MVDKVDKPNPPPAYSVTGATETKRDKPQEQRRQEDLATFQRQKNSSFTEKFQGQTGYTKTVFVPLRQIKTLQYKRSTPRQGIPTADADLTLFDGTKIDNVSFLLRNWQDFMRIKHFKPGDPIPPEFWNFGGEKLEITIRSIHTSGPWNLKEIEQEGAEAAASPTPSSQMVKIWVGVGVLVALGIAALLIWGI